MSQRSPDRANIDRAGIRLTDTILGSSEQDVCETLNALVSFTSDHPKPEWTRYKRENMVSLQKLSFLIDTAVNKNPNLPLPVKLSRQEEQCLIWAAKGRTDQEIADVLNIGFSKVKV